jgi:hypothetical protein
MAWHSRSVIVLAAHRRDLHMLCVMLMRGCHIDRLDIVIVAELLDGGVGASGEIGGKSFARLQPRIGGGYQMQPRIGGERRQHQGESAAQSGDA